MSPATQQRPRAGRTTKPRRTNRQRLLMGAIRGAWTFVFTAAGFGITYLADNFANIGLPVWTGIVIGALAYAAKKAIWPDTLL